MQLLPCIAVCSVLMSSASCAKSELDLWMQGKHAVLFCAAADVNSSSRLSEGEDAESSETASVEGQGKAATSINWMHVRCCSPCLICASHAPGHWPMILD